MLQAGYQATAAAGAAPPESLALGEDLELLDPPYPEHMLNQCKHTENDFVSPSPSHAVLLAAARTQATSRGVPITQPLGALDAPWIKGHNFVMREDQMVEAIDKVTRNYIYVHNRPPASPKELRLHGETAFGWCIAQPVYNKYFTRCIKKSTMVFHLPSTPMVFFAFYDLPDSTLKDLCAAKTPPQTGCIAICLRLGTGQPHSFRGEFMQYKGINVNDATNRDDVWAKFIKSSIQGKKVKGWTIIGQCARTGLQVEASLQSSVNITGTFARYFFQDAVTDETGLFEKQCALAKAHLDSAADGVVQMSQGFNSFQALKKAIGEECRKRNRP